MKFLKIFSAYIFLNFFLSSKIVAAQTIQRSFLSSIPILPMILLVLILIIAGIIFYLQFKKSRETPYNLPSSLSPPSPPSPSIPETTPLSPLTQTVSPMVQPDLGADLPPTPPNQIPLAPPKSQLPFSQPVLIGTAFVILLAIITIGFYFIIRKKPTILVQTIPCGQTTCDSSIQYCDNGVCKQKITPAGDGPGGCCSPGLSPEQGGCRSWEVCDIGNNACSTNLSCRDTTGGGTTPAQGQVSCTADGQSVIAHNTTGESKPIECHKAHGCQGANLGSCSLNTQITSATIPAGGTYTCSAPSPGSCETTQADITGCQSGNNAVVRHGSKCCNLSSQCVDNGPIGNQSCQSPSDCQQAIPTPTITRALTPTTTPTRAPTVTPGGPSLTPTNTPPPRRTPTPTRSISSPTPGRITPTPTRGGGPTLTPTPTSPVIPQCRGLRILINDGGSWRDINDSEKANLSPGTILRLALPTSVNGYNPTKAEFRVIINGATDLEKDTTDVMIVAGIPYYYLEITTKLIDSLSWSNYSIYGWLFINGGWH